MRSAVTVGLVSILSLTATVGSATVMVPLSLEDMSVEAVLVITGRVVSSQSAWDEGHRKIYTYTELQVLERIAGESQARTVVIRTMGGEVGDIGMKVSGTPRFVPDEEALVFLRADPKEPQSFQVVGMSQGKWRVVREGKSPAEVVPSVEGLAFVKRDQTGTFKVDDGVSTEGKMTLDALKVRVTNARRTPPATTIQAPKTPSGPATVPN